MDVIGKLGRQDQDLRKKTEEKLFGRPSGTHFVKEQDQNQEGEYVRKKVEEIQGRENPYGLDAWRKKMLRRMN